jgi:DNA polymerase-3 subunit chi
MKQVDFYLISNRVNLARYKFASRLANKLQRLSKQSLIVTDGPESTAELDTVMWSFSDTSFLAHDPLSDPQPQSRVHIGDHNSVSPAVLERPYDVLINLASDVPMFNHHFSRIAEVVEADEAAKLAARKRYKSYQSEGFELKTHNIEL